MLRSVSIPEKALLEHWSSLYVTYRYRSKAGLWCPASGEDTDVRLLPPRPGKVVQLEPKANHARWCRDPRPAARSNAQYVTPSRVIATIVRHSLRPFLTEAYI